MPGSSPEWQPMAMAIFQAGARAPSSRHVHMRSGLSVLSMKLDWVYLTPQGSSGGLSRCSESLAYSSGL